MTRASTKVPKSFQPKGVSCLAREAAVPLGASKLKQLEKLIHNKLTTCFGSTTLPFVSNFGRTLVELWGKQ